MITFKRLFAAWLAFLSIVAFDPPKFFQTFDLKVFDLFTEYSMPGEPDPRIIIVGIDDKALNKFGRWPWPRDLIGKLVEKLAEFGVTVTALDMTFATETDQDAKELMRQVETEITAKGVHTRHPEFYRSFVGIRDSVSKDAALANSLRLAGNVVSGIMFYDSTDEALRAAASLAMHGQSAEPFRIKMVRRDADSRSASLWFNAKGVSANIPLIQEAAASAGFLNTYTDHDGTIRSHPMLYEYNGNFYPSLALASAIVHEGVQNETQVVFRYGLLQGVYLGERFLPLDSYGRMLIRYMGGDATFKVVSAADVIQKPADDPSLRPLLESKIALVGATAPSIYDLRVTPLGITAGVEIQANAAAGALTSLTISKFGWQNMYDMALALILSLALWFGLPRLNAVAGVALFAGLLGLLGWFTYYMFAAHHLWLNTVTPIMALIVGYTGITADQFLRERKSKKFIQGAFSRYLSPKVIQQIVANPDLLKLGGEKRVMTAFFSDVAGFTTISEKLEPQQIVALLNDYLTLMTDIIHQLDGTVDKFEGDAIIAFWGAPVPIENHAELCVRAAIRMQAVSAQTQARWKQEWGVELVTRMGVNTGPMVVGNMGSKERMDYTMMGDAVNLAARLEGANKYYGSRVMVSQFTHDQVRGKFLFREVDRARVQGKKEAISLYEAIAEIESATEAQRRAVEGFNEALAAFRAREFERAREMFTALFEASEKKDAASALYVNRCRQLAAMPPPEEWDMVYDLAK